MRTMSLHRNPRLLHSVLNVRTIVNGFSFSPPKMFFFLVYFKSLVMVIAISSLFNTKDNLKKE